MSARSLPVFEIAVVAWAVLACLLGVLRGPLALRRLERKIQTLRTMLESDVEYQPLADTTPEMVDLAIRLAPTIAALTHSGFRRIGAIAERIAGSPITGTGVWLASSDGAITARVGAARTAAGMGSVQLMLVSATPDDARYVTLQTARRAGLPTPPFVHRLDVPAGTPVPEVVAAHRAAIADAPALLRCADLDAALADQRRARAAAIAWRRAQSPDALLDFDLQAILGARYAELGPKLRARLTTRLPRAHVRRAQ